MILETAIYLLYPEATNYIDFKIGFDGEKAIISEWNMENPQPTNEELNTVWLEYVKKNKISELNSKCKEDILAGFVSASTGFTFGFDEQDQDNFNQQAVLLLMDTTTATVDWGTESHGIQNLTREQFFTIIKECEAHKRNIKGKYWTLKAQVDLAPNEEQVNVITWNI